jgi:steroid delta-isomerase-like uncharacterized protein
VLLEISHLQLSYSARIGVELYLAKKCVKNGPQINMMPNIIIWKVDMRNIGSILISINKIGGKMKKFLMVIPLAILFCFTLSCQKQAAEEVPAGLTEAEAQHIVQQYLAVFNEGNLALIDEICDPEYVRHDRGLPEDVVGLEAFKNYITSLRTTYPDFKVTIDDLIVKGDKIVTRWTLTGTNTGPLQTPMGELPPTGKKMSVPGAEIVIVANGKITETWIFYNQLYFYQQLGFTLTPPQPEEKK